MEDDSAKCPHLVRPSVSAVPVNETPCVTAPLWGPPDPAHRYAPNQPPDAPATGQGLASWAWFGAWLADGASYVVAVLGALSIGLFVLVVAIALTVVLATCRGSSVGSPGVISGAGLPLLYVAYLNRGGPGNVCSTFANGASCTQ